MLSSTRKDLRRIHFDGRMLARQDFEVVVVVVVVLVDFVPLLALLVVALERKDQVALVVLALVLGRCNIHFGDHDFVLQLRLVVVVVVHFHVVVVAALRKESTAEFDHPNNN